MKTMHVMLVMLGLSTASCAQDIPQNKVPSVVINAFQTKFPDAMDVEWEKKGDIFNVEFDLGKVDHEAWMDATGKIIKHETDIKESELPASVKATIAKDFKDSRIDDVDKIEKDGKVYYNVELDGKTGDRIILFDAAGKQVSDPSFLY